MLSYVARNFIMLNNILASLLPFAALVSSDQVLWATWLWFRAIWLRARWLSGDLTGYYSFKNRTCFVVNQGLKSEIYYTFIPLVSSHRCLKSEVCCTFILLVSSHNGLKNKIAETLYSAKINFLCALRLIKFERHDPAFRATWPVTLEHNRVISRYSLKWTDLENANADRLFKVLTNV